jgi:hypothetical protein
MGDDVRELLQVMVFLFQPFDELPAFFPGFFELGDIFGNAVNARYLALDNDGDIGEVL